MLSSHRDQQQHKASSPAATEDGKRRFVPSPAPPVVLAPSQKENVASQTPPVPAIAAKFPLAGSPIAVTQPQPTSRGGDLPPSYAKQQLGGTPKTPTDHEAGLFARPPARSIPSCHAKGSGKTASSSQQMGPQNSIMRSLKKRSANSASGRRVWTVVEKQQRKPVSPAADASKH